MSSYNSSGFDVNSKDLDSSERHDRLSELPDSLILSILSFLSMYDVVRTTILSKRWKDLWVTIPCLHFIIIRDIHFRYVDFINGALAQWKCSKMLKFSLHLSYQFGHSFDSDIHSWLLFAIEKQVEELSIDLDSRYSNFVAPQRLYSCSSITKLSLAFHDLEIEDKVQWNKLKSLTIRVDESLSEEVMNQVLCGAPHLEELILSFREISKNLNIRSTSLKMLKIDAYTSSCNAAVLGIWAPNLVTLEISGVVYHDYSLVPSCTHVILSLKKSDWEFLPCENFTQVFGSISHVEKLTLSEWCIKLLLFMKDRNMDVPFSNAKFLKLYVHEDDEMLDVFVFFPKLMHTIIDHRDDKDPSYFVAPKHLDTLDYHKAFFRSPSLVELRTVEITWSAGDASIIQVMECLSEKAHKLEKMVLQLRMAGEEKTLLEDIYPICLGHICMFGNL
ncbi:F-box/LRR-repeat protein At3g26922-like [Salvia miltiorrhiza]|uniref:F-box/LRR-repeat protein At3g26922-like n=1 Tax=Salvia miltiorrhiza TaxID=226208 RepID=UPI0025AC12CE|nr:F-box/LRR-repeat protein At3g26922-like [Salvia miltiorrhiza]